MADVTVTPVARPAANTRTIDLIAGGSAITTGQTFEIVAGADWRGLRIIVEDSGGSAATWTFDAGDYPPSMTQGKGSLVFALAASDLRELFLERGRHAQNDGKINGSVSGGTVRLYAYYAPLGY